MAFKARFPSEYEEDMTDADRDYGANDEGDDDEVDDNPKKNKANHSPADSKNPKKKSRTTQSSCDSEAAVINKNKAQTANPSNKKKTHNSPVGKRFLKRTWTKL